MQTPLVLWLPSALVDRSRRFGLLTLGINFLKNDLFSLIGIIALTYVIEFNAPLPFLVIFAPCSSPLTLLFD